jgi:hypothetical protein
MPMTMSHPTIRILYSYGLKREREQERGREAREGRGVTAVREMARVMAAMTVRVKATKRAVVMTGLKGGVQQR